MSPPEQALVGGHPQALTMERLGDKDELIVAQSTSQCCRSSSRDGPPGGPSRGAAGRGARRCSR